jgi:DeoR/GlpR family transcriptional regulator of sugar metabolism
MLLIIFSFMKVKNGLLKVDRHRQILDLVASRQSVSLKELEEILAASRITIQRDLVELEARNLLKRFHGGAMSLQLSDNLQDHGLRKSINIEGKRKIVKKALKLIKPGQFVALDASSTVYYLSEQVLPHNISVLACGVDTFSNLSRNMGIHVMLCGGRLNRTSNTLAGPETVEMIRKFRFDLVFISADNFVPGRGFFDPEQDQADAKQALMESATKTVMLIDGTKIGDQGGIKICDENEIDILITDDPGKSDFRKYFKKGLM